jgi:hypothetical protein
MHLFTILQIMYHLLIYAQALLLPIKKLDNQEDATLEKFQVVMEP